MRNLHFAFGFNYYAKICTKTRRFAYVWFCMTAIFVNITNVDMLRNFKILNDNYQIISTQSNRKCTEIDKQMASSPCSLIVRQENVHTAATPQGKRRTTHDTAQMDTGPPSQSFSRSLSCRYASTLLMELWWRFSFIEYFRNLGLPLDGRWAPALTTHKKETYTSALRGIQTSNPCVRGAYDFRIGKEMLLWDAISTNKVM